MPVLVIEADSLTFYEKNWIVWTV